MYVGSLSPVTNQRSWEPIYQITDSETGEGIDLTSADIVFEVRDQKSKTTVLSATTQAGTVALLDTGTFQVSFARTQMQTLYPGMFDVGCVITINGSTQQPMAGILPVLDGIVSQ